MKYEFIMKKLLIGICFLVSSLSFAQSPGDIQITGVIDGDTLRAEIVGLSEPLKHVSIRIMRN